MKYSSLIFLIFFTLSCYSNSYVRSPKYMNVLETLTYPNSQWKGDDLGNLPSPDRQALLKKTAPTFWIDKNSCGPMDFYKQYVPILRLKKGEKVFQATRKKLKIFERDFSVKYQLMKKPECIESKNPPLYAYSWDEVMELSNGHKTKIKVLKYAFSFYKSGLPAKQTFVQKMGGILGDPELWHYLDIHGAIFYLLNEDNKIFSVVIGQHNHFRTYIVNVDINQNEAKNICFAIRSNEPYLCGKEEKATFHPTVPTPEHIRWVIAKKDRPWFASWDKVPAKSKRKNIQYKVTFLRDKDPLITSWNSLAPNLKVLKVFNSVFRKAPPGMAIYTNPQAKEVWKTAQYFYFNPNNSGIFDLHETEAKGFLDINMRPVLRYNAIRFTQRLMQGKWVR